MFYAVTTEAGTGTRSDFRVDFSSGIQAPVPKTSGKNLLEPFLDALAQETGGDVVQVEGRQSLTDVSVAVLKEFRERYLLTCTPTGVNRAGWHRIEVRSKGRPGTVVSRRGYV